MCHLIGRDETISFVIIFWIDQQNMHARKDVTFPTEAKQTCGETMKQDEAPIELRLCFHATKFAFQGAWLKKQNNCPANTVLL